MAKKPGFTREEHAEVGKALAGINDELAHRVVQVASAYPKNGPDVAALRAAIKALGKARNLLDERVHAENRGEDMRTVYYPHPEDRPTLTAPMD